MTNAPSRHGHVAGSSLGPAIHIPPGGDQARRRYSPERRRRATARPRRLRGMGRLVLLVLIVLVSVWVGTRIANATSDVAAFTEQTYVVHDGDTLWGIARASYQRGGDVRRLVYLIERRNDLPGGDIRPGQRLILPVLPD
jgi:hypothetical protein